MAASTPGSVPVLIANGPRLPAGGDRRPAAPGPAADQPDGSRVLFTVRPASRRGEHRTQHVWVAGSGRAARPFTAGAGNDAEPEWSPEGQSIVFHSDRETRGTGRLYVIPADGGEAQPLSSISGDLSHPV